MTKTQYIIRADGNAQIGVGHIMRTLTIADALCRSVNREQISYVCADEGSAEVARARGYAALVLHTSYERMEEELPLWEQLEIHNARILVDSYHVTSEYLRALRRYGSVCLLDDLQEMAYPVDTVINYNVFADPGRYTELYQGQEPKTAYYLGGSYVPIREQFVACGYELRENVKDVMITTGGGDSANIAGAIYQTLAAAFPEMTFHVISGVFNPYFAQLQEWERQADNLIVYHDVQDMAAVMKKCDAAVSAGGSTLYELSAVGVPVICFSYAHNQEPMVHYMGENISVQAGAYDRDPAGTLANIREGLRRMQDDEAFRRECFDREQKLIDGRGAERIANVLIKENG